MIKSFKDKWLENFYRDNQNTHNIPWDIESRVYTKLQLMYAATSEKNLRSPPGNKLEKLSGKLTGLHSIRVNQQYRLIFQWTEAGAADVYLDKHIYRKR